MIAPCSPPCTPLSSLLIDFKLMSCFLFPAMVNKNLIRIESIPPLHLITSSSESLACDCVIFLKVYAALRMLFCEEDIFYSSVLLVKEREDTEIKSRNDVSIMRASLTFCLQILLSSTFKSRNIELTYLSLFEVSVNLVYNPLELSCHPRI